MNYKDGFNYDCMWASHSPLGELEELVIIIYQKPTDRIQGRWATAASSLLDQSFIPTLEGCQSLRFKGSTMSKSIEPHMFSATVCLSVHSWTSAFLLAVNRLCGVIEGRLSHFLQRWLRTGRQSVISRGKIPWNTPPRLGIESGPHGGQTVRFIHSPPDLSRPGQRRGQNVRFVQFPTELSWLIQFQ